MKTSKIEKKQVMEDLFFADLEIHAIRFAEWIAKYGYEKVFEEKKGWLTYYEEDTKSLKVKSFTIKALYKQFMIDDLCL